MAAGELGVFLSLRGKAEMVAGLREMTTGLRGVARGLKDVGVAGDLASGGVSKAYATKHVEGLRMMRREVGLLHSSLKTLSGFAVPAFGFGIAAGLADGVKQAVNLQSALANIKNFTDVRQQDMGTLSKGAMQIAAKTGIPAVSVANDVLYHVEGTLNKGGNLSAKSALATTGVISNLAAIGHADPDVVARTFVSLKALGIKGSENDQALAGKLIKIVGSGGTMRFTDLADALANTGKTPTFMRSGMDLNDVGAALATFTDMGLKAPDAMNTYATSVFHAISPTKQAANVEASLGLNRLGLATALRKGGGMGMLGLLRSRLNMLPGGIEGEKATEDISTIFGKSKGASPIFTLINDNAMKMYRENFKTETTGSPGTYGAASALNDATWSQQYKDYRQKINNSLINVGNVVTPGLIRAGRGVGDLVSGKLNAVAGDLGMHGGAASVFTGDLHAAVGAAQDLGKVFTSDVLPVAKTLGLALGGTVTVGLHALKDVTGFMAEHSTTTEAVLYAMTGMFVASKAAAGVSALAMIPQRLGVTFAKSAGGIGTTMDNLAHPMQRFRTGWSDTMGANTAATRRAAASQKGSFDLMNGSLKSTAGGVESSVGRMTKAIGALGIGASAFGGYEVGKSSGTTAGVLTGAAGGALSGAAFGPEGALIGGAIGGLAGLVGGLHKASQSLQDFSGAVDADKGKFGGNVTQAISKSLTDVGKNHFDELAALTSHGVTSTDFLRWSKETVKDRQADMGAVLGPIAASIGKSTGDLEGPIINALTSFNHDVQALKAQQAFLAPPSPKGMPAAGALAGAAGLGAYLTAHPEALAAAAAAGGVPPDTHVHVHIDGKQVAQAVAKATSNIAARK